MDPDPRGAYGFGLSLPVGPFPRAGLFAGGKLRAARSALFSSSNSATRLSSACGMARGRKWSQNMNTGDANTSRDEY